jgi:hypothetical protein
MAAGVESMDLTVGFAAPILGIITSWLASRVAIRQLAGDDGGEEVKRPTTLPRKLDHITGDGISWR